MTQFKDETPSVVEYKNGCCCCRCCCQKLALTRRRCFVFRQVGCTNWMRVFMVMSGKVNVSRLEDLKEYDVHLRLQSKYLTRLSRFPPQEIQGRIKSYFKFMFVRHPFERVVSGYEDKLVNPKSRNYHRQTLGMLYSCNICCKV